MNWLGVEEVQHWTKETLVKAISGARDGDIVRAPDGTLYQVRNPRHPRPSMWDPDFRQLVMSRFE